MTASELRGFVGVPNRTSQPAASRWRVSREHRTLARPQQYAVQVPIGQQRGHVIQSKAFADATQIERHGGAQHCDHGCPVAEPNQLRRRATRLRAIGNVERPARGLFDIQGDSADSANVSGSTTQVSPASRRAMRATSLSVAKRAQPALQSIQFQERFGRRLPRIPRVGMSDRDREVGSHGLVTERDLAWRVACASRDAPGVSQIIEVARRQRQRRTSLDAPRAP